MKIYCSLPGGSLIILVLLSLFVKTIFNRIFRRINTLIVNMITTPFSRRMKSKMQICTKNVMLLVISKSRFFVLNNPKGASIVQSWRILSCASSKNWQQMQKTFFIQKARYEQKMVTLKLSLIVFLISS